MSCVGRERIFDHFSRTQNTPVSIIRLNYAVEMRYGVLHDIGGKVLRGEGVDLSMGAANVIWQADANASSICAFDHASAPPFILNVTGPETLSVRRLAEEFGRLFNKPPTFTGSETNTALLNNAQLSHRLYGYPRIPVRQVILWTVDWLKRGGPAHNKPTHFETRDSQF
jgi:nucleoside-diphosphate-sugar epimerase